MLAVAPKLQHERANVGTRRDENHEYGVRGEHRYDEQPGFMLEDGGPQIAAAAGAGESACGSEQRRYARSECVAIHSRVRVAGDQQSVGAQHDGCIHARALPNCRHKIAYAGHQNSTGEVVAKLRLDMSEVKPCQSLEQFLTLSYSSHPSPSA